MKKVYVLSMTMADDYAGDECIRVFSTREKAQKVMNQRYSAELNDFQSVYGDENISYDLSENSAYVQERGNYNRNHIDFIIKECEVE